VTTLAPARVTDLLAAVLRGDAISWTAFDLTPADFLEQCNEQDVAGLVYERVRVLPAAGAWPADVVDALAGEVRTQAARELLYERELRSVLAGLAARDLTVIIMKGTALAYSYYEAPWLRPRIDTDLLMRRDDVDRLRAAMADLGYTAPVFCEGELLFCQFPLQRTGECGIVHRFDCHWKISTQPVFADVVSFDDAVERASAVPGLGASARALAPIDALMLACIHPAMHHRNVASLLWLFDVHLLASALPEREFVRFASIAVDKRVAAVCAHQLRAAQARLGTRVPEAVLEMLSAPLEREPSMVYLRSNRGWFGELVSSLGGLPRWRDRMRLLREIVFPAPAYMLKTAGFGESWLGVVLLPVLYIRRLVSGGWRVLAGQK
jgi:hypothetical protein